MSRILTVCSLLPLTLTCNNGLVMVIGLRLHSRDESRCGEEGSGVGRRIFRKGDI